MFEPLRYEEVQAAEDKILEPIACARGGYK